MRAGATARTLPDIRLTLVNTPSARILHNVSIIPISGEINITITQWDETKKVWKESSEAHDTSTRHIIGDFPANNEIRIFRDDVDYEVVVSNKTGYIDWTYTGGYGDEYEFEAVSDYTVPPIVTDHASLTNVSEDAENAGISPVNSLNFSDNNSGKVNCGYTMMSITITAFGTAVIIFWFHLRK
jgi:hypothetical protein